MTAEKPINPTELDQAQTAQKIQQAEIADETAAYVNAGDTKETADTNDAEAHPS